eukprot:CAMPEP_0185569468 /NCGR_PEP_ID=MMETSP0434-20130131/2076_1 /TAXON_ID=626734 ORGANISM="Favella taraikaensis, Strain Fe Narragansett Bay" /NCGR_SAMPLE_ID=MMETSP0434 /ASSEMBLY_ACC=CAM_ASM_000379 /LENGTH=51 /DNA_ID=CAMNT_0028184255 /DNA_START=495 /DNA_END=650 /DNA_ORIENTATION=-
MYNDLVITDNSYKFQAAYNMALSSEDEAKAAVQSMESDMDKVTSIVIFIVD